MALSSPGRIKTQTVLPSADTAAMLFWALLASGQINMRKVDGWQTLTVKPSNQPIDLAARNDTFMFPENVPRPIPTTSRTAPTGLSSGDTSDFDPQRTFAWPPQS